MPLMPSDVPQYPDCLRRLDNDVLQIIFEALRPRRSLRALSMTCKWIRDACSPVLFRRCIIGSSRLDRAEVPDFIPPSLWPHIQELVLNGPFSRKDLPEWIDSYPHPDPIARKNQLLRISSRCAAAQRVGQNVRDLFSSMPYLQSVEVLLPYTESLFNPPTGISWHVLVGILSVPSLRSFRFKGPMWHPNDKIPDDLDFAPTTSLESFRYDIDALLHHLPSRDTTKEQEALSLVLGRLRDSLKQLILPPASAPFDTMMTWNWPSLRELSLRGERVATSLPLIEMLFKTPRLQILSLILAEPADSSPPPIWPPGFAMTGQLPDIEQITVTHPHAEDELYAHLPATLRRLTLRCWPRYYKHRSILNEFMTDAGVDWSSPILTSSEMLHILKRTQKPHLTHLELEYRADADDEKLWRHIGSSYPQLTVLRVHRYRASGEADSNVPVHEITRALSALGRLRLLMICLDFATEPYATTFSDYPTLAQLTRAQRGKRSTST